MRLQQDNRLLAMAWKGQTPDRNTQTEAEADATEEAIEATANRALQTRDERPIVLFDAMCVLCSANARFILATDRRRRFRLASIQGDAGAAICRAAGVDPTDPTTMIVVDGDAVHRNSDAVLRVYEGLGYPWRAMGALRIIPERIRDAAYLAIARNRYRLFGRRETCWIPRPEDRDRLL